MPKEVYILYDIFDSTTEYSKNDNVIGIFDDPYVMAKYATDYIKAMYANREHIPAYYGFVRSEHFNIPEKTLTLDDLICEYMYLETNSYTNTLSSIKCNLNDFTLYAKIVMKKEN